VYADGTVVVQIENDSESFAAGIDAITGVNRWKMDRPKNANWTSPVLLKGVNGQTLAGLQSAKGFLAVAPATGQIVWDYSEGASTIPSSAVSGDVIYVPSNGLTAIQPAPEGQTPKQLWRNNQLRPGTASPLVLGQHVYTLNEAGVLSCGSITNGTRLWQLRLKGPFSAAGQRLYLVNEKGLTQVVDPTKPEGELVSELPLGETVLGTPSISGGAIYIRSDGHLWKLGKS
jgi:outer membrane protein assembly factor BamB